jgi:hypothetical protein
MKSRTANKAILEQETFNMLALASELKAREVCVGCMHGLRLSLLLEVHSIKV